MTIKIVLDDTHNTLSKIKARSHGRLLELSINLNNFVVDFLSQIYDDIRWDIAPDTRVLNAVICPPSMARNLIVISEWFRQKRPKVSYVYNDRPIPKRDPYYEEMTHHLTVTMNKIASL